MKPPDYFRRQVHVCYWFEKESFRAALSVLGPDNIMFETDFPHPTCRYPDPRAHAAKELADVQPSVHRKLLSSNAPKAAQQQCGNALPDPAAGLSHLLDRTRSPAAPSVAAA